MLNLILYVSVKCIYIYYEIYKIYVYHIYIYLKIRKENREKKLYEIIIVLNIIVSFLFLRS